MYSDDLLELFESVLFFSVTLETFILVILILQSPTVFFFLLVDWMDFVVFKKFSQESLSVGTVRSRVGVLPWGVAEGVIYGLGGCSGP